MKIISSLALSIVLSFGFVVFSGCESSSYDMSEIDNDALDAEDFEEYIADAKRSASSENFSAAYSHLEKARKLGVSTSEYSSAKSYVASKEKAYEERIERERQERMARESQNYNSGGVYITNWGYDFSGDNRIWGRNGVKLSNGSTFYTWLERQSYGSRCYNLSVQGGVSGHASNCSNSINGSWSTSCASSSGQFLVHGDQSTVVEAIVSRCAN